MTLSWPLWKSFRELMCAFLMLNGFVDVYKTTRTNKGVAVTFTKYILAFVNDCNDLRDK